MDFSHIISMLFHDKPEVMYENPPPPNDDCEYDFETIFFTYPRPQSVPDVKVIKVDRSLIHKSLLGHEEKEVELTAPENLRGKDNIKCNENTEGIKAIETEEVCAEVSINKSVSEMVISRSNISKENSARNDALDEANIKRKNSQIDEFARFLKKKKERKEKNRSKEEKKNDIDSDYSKSGKTKNALVTKSVALQSISNSYSMSESDSDHGEKRKTKSPSRHAKSHSKKSSRRHKRKHKDSRISVKQEIISSDEEHFSSFSKKAEGTKEEVLSDKDDYKKEKVKRSKSSKKKYDSSSDDSRNHDDSKKCTVSRTWDDSRSCDESRNKFDGSRSHEDFTKNRFYSSDDDSRNRRFDEDSLGSSKSFDPFMQREMKLETKQESGSANYYPPNDYYCDVCKLILNSETTFSSHMAGKKHKKALRQLSEQEVAKSSIFEITESQNFPRAPDMERIVLHEESKIQKTCDDAELLIVGLDYVREIRGYEDTKYFCELCSAQCVANSIIKHLIGYKHQMNCLKIYCFKSYDWVKDLDKRDRRAAGEITFQLKEAKRRHGIGKIKVYKDVKRNTRNPEPYNPYQPSTSKAVLVPKDIQGKKTDEPKITDEECLSRDFSDFYCTVCDSHMNNYAMWESHARGKKHAKNKKKLEEGSVTNINIEESRDIISNLEELIHEECGPNDIIVGLNFIRENRGENGDLYNCYLCGSVCTTVDIIDHLYLKKHKSKYLEKMLADGYNNAINEINCLPIGESAREVLVDDECEKLMIELGRGKPIVALTKKTF